jgi:hypothetical protein
MQICGLHEFEPRKRLEFPSLSKKAGSALGRIGQFFPSM